MTSSADYGVAIAENFQPPETWVPGQQINKDAGAVNTGNVDAFVRMQLSGKMRLLQQNRLAANATSGMKAGYTASSAGSGSSFTNPTTAVTDTDLLKAGITLMDASGNYFKTLSTTQAVNPTLTLGSSHAGFTGNTSTALSEVQAMQSGILAYAPTDAEYTYILNEPTTLTIKVATIDGTDTTAANDYQTVEVPAGTLVHVGGTAGTGVAYTTGASSTLTIPAVAYTDIMGNTGTAIATVYVQAQTHDDSATFFVPQNVEYETFVPITDGLYLFLRNEDDANQSDPEFSGYYKKTQDITNNENTALSQTGVPVYYALNTDTQRANRSEYAVKGATTATYAAPVAVTYDGTSTNAKNIRHIVPDTKLELFTAQYSDVAASNLKFYASDVSSNKQTLYAVYDKNGSDNTFTAADDVVVEINLANINASPEGWSEKGSATAANTYTLDGTSLTSDATKLTFYYNNDLEAGDTTAKLVDNVKLYQGVTNKAYLAFDFDLNVALESVQVTFGEDGTESATALSEWTADSGNWTGATGTATMGTGAAAKEIASVSWS